jgi:hypothetical protein
VIEHHKDTKWNLKFKRSLKKCSARECGCVPMTPGGSPRQRCGSPHVSQLAQERSLLRASRSPLGKGIPARKKPVPYLAA